MSVKISVNLSKLNADKFRDDKNGDKWVDLLVTERKTVGNFGETHFVAMDQSKEEREAGTDTEFVGSGKDLQAAAKNKEADAKPNPHVKNKVKGLRF